MRSAVAVQDVLIFEMAQQRYAVAVADVVQVMPAVAPVPLPGGPSIVEGLVNVRGRVVPLLDLRGRFGLPGKETELTDHLIMARAGPRVVAVRVDRAVEVMTLGAGEVENAPAVTYGSQYVAGIAILRDGLAMIHDLNTFLSHNEAEQMDEALAKARFGSRA